MSDKSSLVTATGIAAVVAALEANKNQAPTSKKLADLGYSWDTAEQLEAFTNDRIFSLKDKYGTIVGKVCVVRPLGINTHFALKCQVAAANWEIETSYNFELAKVLVEARLCEYLTFLERKSTYKTESDTTCVVVEQPQVKTTVTIDKAAYETTLEQLALSHKTYEKMCALHLAIVDIFRQPLYDIKYDGVHLNADTLKALDAAYRLAGCDAPGNNLHPVHIAPHMLDPNPKPKLDTTDWDALWHYHNDEQYKCADKQDYGDAQYHKEKADKIWKFLNPGKK